MRCGARCGLGGGRAVRWRQRKHRAGGAPDWRGWGAGHATERTTATAPCSSGAYTRCDACIGPLSSR
eukprot:scaffold63785_cov45-Phaeocystis_antarctica.AAC.1